MNAWTNSKGLESLLPQIKHLTVWYAVHITVYIQAIVGVIYNVQAFSGQQCSWLEYQSLHLLMISRSQFSANFPARRQVRNESVVGIIICVGQKERHDRL